MGEVSTKCIKKSSDNDDDRKEIQNEKKEEKEEDVAPFCHHKLAMKQILVTKKGKNNGKSFWICAKPQSEKCTAFKWNKKEKILKDEFEIEQREKFDKIVLLIRIANIIESSVDVKFAKDGQVAMQFETEEFKYRKM